MQPLLDKSLTLFERGCKYGYGDSCSFLGMHFLRKGIFFFQLSFIAFAELLFCQDLSHNPSLRGIAKRDPQRALSLLHKACDSFNNVNACYNLGVLYKNGKACVYRSAMVK